MSIPNSHHLKSDNSTKQLQTSPVGFSNVSRSSTFHYCFSPPTLNNNENSNSLQSINNKSPVIPICGISSKTNSFKSSPSSDVNSNKNTIEYSTNNHQMQKNVLHSAYAEAIESECLEHYEINLERYKDERDAIQKKTFTKWVNQHLSKTNKIVEDLFFDLRDGRNLIDLLELLTAENLPRENGMTRFHRIQNVQSCLEFLRRRNIRLVNIRPEDIVDGNGKLTLGLIWTIILNFQVSAVINYQQKSQRRQDITVHISATTSPHNKIINSHQDEGVHYSQTTARLIAESSVSQRERQTPSPETSSFSSETRTTTSARDALLAWARRVISTFHPEVDVHNFSSNWRDGFAFDAILHCFRPELVNWEKVLHLSARERLQFAFDTFESEYGIAKLLDPEDVCDVETPDERSLITYVSMLHNRLINEPKGGYDDVLSRLTRGIGITNEKLDHLLVRIDNVNVAEERGERFEILERQVREIVDDLHALKPPIDELFTDVETLRQQRHSQTADLNKQVVGLEQRRAAYLGRLEDGIMTRLGIRPKAQFVTERVTSTTTADGGSLAYKGNAFRRVEDAIQWIRDRMYKLNTMQFSETLEMLEQMFEKQKLDNRDIQDFRQTVDECIARQAEVSAEDSYDYFELLKILESEYQQLRELSAGRMVDLDSLIAFIRAAQLELVWIHEREELEVTRNWSAVQQLDIPMLQNYFKQLLHEIELHEKQFNDVHNQGAALINQRHPAGEVIEVYLRTMQNQWDWLLNLSKCLEGHLRDAYNAKSFLEESDQIEQQMQQQLNHLDHSYNRTDFSLDEGERMLRELDSIREHIQQLHARLLSLTERCSQISPLWQRGERIGRPIPVISLCEYKSKESHVRQGDECTLLDNHDLLHWCIRGMDGVEASVPSVVFRIPPPDPRLSNLLSRFHGQFERLRKLWDRKHHLTRYNMVLSTMRTVRGWDLDTFLSIPPDQRDEIIKALNEDVNKLLSELDPNDPLARRLKDELRLTNEHFYDLLGRAQKGPEPNYANEFDAAAVELIRKFEDAFKQLSERAQIRIPNNLEQLEHQIREHKIFEDNLQALDVDVSNVKELFRQLPSPTPNQRAKHDLMISRWEEIWDLCRMYVERLKALENVLKSVDEVSDIVRRHEVTLSSFDDMPAALERLRGVHAQLVELLMVLQQQRSIVENLNKDTAQIRSHVARTRLGVQHHPDVDQLEELVTNLTVRWDNVNSQVTDRLRIAEEAQQTQMVYRSQYDEELQWLDRVEATINSLRRPEDLRPEDLRPEELQGQLDQLTAEYAQLQEHTATIEAINNEGGKFIRDARSYDIKLAQYHDNIISAHGQRIKDEFRRQIPQPKNGAQIVTEELEALNRRFAQLSSVILERKNIVNVLIQNWRRKQQEEEERIRLEEEAKRRAFEAARRKALEEADRLRREREAAEAARRAAEEQNRLKRQKEALADDEARRRKLEDERRRRQEEEDRRHREDLERLRKAADEAERRRLIAKQEERDEAERRRRREKEAEEEEKRRRKAAQDEDDRRNRQKRWEGQIKAAQVHEQVPMQQVEEFQEVRRIPEVPKLAEHEDEPQMFQEETVTKTQFYEMEGILHKQTGEILTFVEAIRQGLLDLSSGGEFFDIVSGSRVSLDKAVEMGLISENITEILNGRHGIRHPETGQELTLMEAIQIGLYDPDSRQLRDIKTGELLSLFEARHICPTDVQHRLIKMGVLKLPPMELEQALKSNVLNPQTGEFRGKYVQEAVTFRDALANGYIQFPSGQPLLAITLTDCIEDGFIDSHSGEFIDKSGEKFTLREALDRQRPLIRDNVRECVNTALNQRVTVAEAVLANALNPRTGKFTDLKSRIELSLKEAHDYGLIQKPLTLTEVVDKGHYDSNGLFLDRGNRFTLLEAINAGWLDPDVRHIVSEQDQEVISISDALERGLLTPEGRIKLDWTESAGAHSVGRELDLYDAQRQGLLIRRIRHTIFDVKGIRNTESNANLSFNEAVEAGILQLPSERVVDQQRRQNYSLSDAVREGILDSALADILSSPPCGLSDNGIEVTLIRAVAKGLVDAKKGVIIDRSQRELSVREAYSHGMFGSLRAAMRLAALFDVHPLLMTAVKKRPQTRRRIQRPGTVSGGAQLPEDQVKVTLAEAMRMGLVDARTQRFRQGKNEMSLDDALHQGLIDPHSEWIVPSRASGVGPTIEERTQETVTETGQQLAPKIFPDKELQESVQTVHRVKRTETSAVGGPGGVSVYRAVTGGKDAIEVPENGYHVLEAERKGLLDLNTGIVRPPGTDKSLNLEEAFILGVLNPSSVSIRDSQSGRSLKVDEAFKQKLIDRNGFVEHHGRRLSLQQAIDERIAHIEPEPPALITGAKKKLIQFSSAAGAPVAFRPVGQPVVEESEYAWTFDSNRGVFIDLNTKESIPLDSAIRSGHLSPDDLRARDALTGREFTLTEAEKWGIVNIREGYYLDKTDNKRYSFTEAARQHRIYPTGGVPENAADALQTTVRIHKRSEVAMKEAVPTTTSGVSSVSGFHSPTEFSLNRYVDQRHFDSSSGLFTHPDVQKQMTLKELIIKGLLNPYNTKIVDRVKGTELRLLDAIQENIVDDIAGTVRDTQTGKVYDFTAAVRQGLVKEDLRPLAIESTSHVPVFEERRASRVSAGGGSPRLVERKLQLTPYAQEPFRRSGGDSLSPPSARRSGSAGAGSLGEIGLGSGRGTSTWSIGGGPTQPKQHRLSGTVGDSSPSYSRQEFSSTTAAPTGGAVRGPLSTLTGPNERMVDLGGGKTVKVNVIRGADGLEKGEYFDPASNMKFTIQLHGDPITTQTSTKVRSTSQVQSVELEPHAQFVGIDQIKDLRNGRVMSLADAQRLGLARVDRKGRLSTREYSAFRSNIELAVNKGVMDARGEKLSLEEAIRQRLIDIRELKYIHPRNGEAIDLSSAANQGLVDVTLAETLPNGVHHPGTGEKISVKRAVDLGIIDARTGAVRHPFTGEPLSWVDLTRKVYNAITQNGVYDPRKGYAVPVTSALADGLIDARSGGIYINPITQERHSLEEASHRGLIDSQTLRALTEPCLTDYQTRRRINLIQAVEAKLIDPRAKTVQLSADKIVSLQKAIEEGAIPAEVGEHLRRVDKLTFAEAVGKGLIDVAQDRYTSPETGKQMTIADAVSQGLIDTGTVKSGDEPGERTNLARVIASDEFEERSGRIQDPQTRLYLPFSAAVSQRLVDPDSLLHDLNSSKTITLREALNLGLIDSQGRYVPKAQPGQHTLISPVPLKEAVQRGLIALIGSPMQAAQAVSEALKRRDAEGYKFRLEPLDDATLQRLSTGSGRSPIHEETIIRTRRPREPSLSERVRSSGGYSGDGDVSLRGSRVRSGDVDPLELADLQNDFISLLQQQGFDLDEKCVENPSTMRMMSIREAVESGLFDVSTGNLVNPISGRYYPVHRAISMRLVQTSPEKGQKLSDALAQVHEKHGGLPGFRRSEQQFSPGSISLGSYAGVSDPYQRRSSFGIEVDTSPTSLPPISNRLSWSSRNVDWRGDTAELRSRPELADVRHASVERGIDGSLPPGIPVPPPTAVIGQTGSDFHRDIEEFRRGEPSEGPLNIDRTRTHISPDGQTRTTTHYTHHRSEY